ncbi:MAG: hypothetical protein AAB839_00200 [Patescibacteria group bacterium]
MSRFLFFVFLLPACTSLYVATRGTDDQGTEYMLGRMADIGCPCNFLADDGPRVYSCTENVPDRSVVSLGYADAGPISDGIDATMRPHYIIYEDGAGEADVDANRNDFFPRTADPEMVALQARGKELGCRPVNPEAYLPGFYTADERQEAADSNRYSCVISTCEAYATPDGKIEVRKKADLPDGA